MSAPWDYRAGDVVEWRVADAHRGELGTVLAVAGQEVTVAWRDTGVTVTYGGPWSADLFRRAVQS